MNKRTPVIICLWLFSIALFAQITKSNNDMVLNTITLEESQNNTVILHLNLTHYGFNESVTPRGLSKLIDAPNSSSILEKGAPDLPKFTTSLLIPDLAEMEVIVLSSKYIEYPNIDIAPSKGNLYRHTNPDKIAFEYGNTYDKDAFFPKHLVALDEPYVLRDFCGQAVQFYPFQYNPVQKILRVYTELVVEIVEKAPLRNNNPLYRLQPLSSINREFYHIYKRHFINYKSIENIQYIPLEEHGRMLIISHAPYMTAMTPFVEWKNTIGIPTTIVDVSTIGGTNPGQVKTYIQNYYDTTDLAFVLFVGDNMHIAPFPNSTPGITGPSDNAYGYLAGNDRYPDIFVGRFSAESVDHVVTQVNRTISYERADSLGNGWLNTSMGVARNEGAGIGHNGESDCEHMDLIRTRLLTYNYNTVHQEYDQNCTGVPNTNAATISNKINSGVGMINYCNHGSPTSWSVANYNSTHVNALTNTNKWPFIWSVACVNGEFVNQTCFAEVWLRATHNEQPSGALATLMSTINQSWHPPMDAQDEFNDILIGSYTNNIKRTFGGISFNGMYKMNDINGNAGYEMTDTWNLFGDPSVVVRTDNPIAMNVTHPASIMIYDNSVAVNCNINDAYAVLSVNGEIIGTGTISGGSSNISISQLTGTDSITVAVTAYNKIPYLGKIAVIDFMYDVDAGLTTLIDPKNHYSCSNINIYPTVVLRNHGIDTLTSVTINYRINNGNTIPYSWSGILSSHETDTISLSPILLAIGTHTFEVFTSNPNGVIDQNMANDTVTRLFVVQDLPIVANFSADATNFCSYPASVNFLNLSQSGQNYFWDFGDGHTSTLLNPTHIYDSLGVYSVTLIADAGACGQDAKTDTAYIIVGLDLPQVVSASNCGPASLTLEANGLGTINWYDDIAATNLVFTGNTFVTPFLTSTKNYYVRNESTHSAQFGGKSDSLGSGGYFGNIQHQHYQIFDAFIPFKIVSVKVYAGAAGSRTISLRDSYGNIIQSVTETLPIGESRVTLDFNVPVGTDLRLQGDGNPNLYRSNNNSATYPYTVQGMFSITESSASLAPYNVTGNYYYFYDWEVKEEDCYSAMQTVTATILDIPTADFSYSVNGTVVSFTNLSPQSSSFLWSFGDGNFSTDPNPTHTYSSVGNFTVQLITSNICGTDTVTYSVTTNMAAPLADFYANNIVISEGDYVNFFDISGNSPNSWHWIFEGGFPSSSNLQNPSIQYNTAGNYYVTLLASNTYGTDFANKPSYITVLTTQIDELSGASEMIYLSPNPSSKGYIDCFINTPKTTNISINMYNAIGALVKTVVNNRTFTKGHHNERIDLGNLSSGMYFLTITADELHYFKKIMVAH